MSSIDNTADIVAIRALVDQYSAGANRLNPKEMAAVYAEDGEVVAFGTGFKGRDTIEEVFSQTIGLMEVMSQICSGGEITVDGDTAKGHWTVTEYAKRKDMEQVDLFLGDYEDEMVRTADGWRFAQRTFTVRGMHDFENAPPSLHD